MDTVRERTKAAVIRGNGFFCCLNEMSFCPRSDEEAADLVFACALREIVEEESEGLSFLYERSGVFVYRGALRFVRDDKGVFSLTFVARNEEDELCIRCSDGIHPASKVSGKGRIAFSVDTRCDLQPINVFLYVCGEPVFCLQAEQRKKPNLSSKNNLKSQRSRSDVLRHICGQLRQEKRRLSSVLVGAGGKTAKTATESARTEQQKSRCLSALVRCEQRIKDVKAERRTNIERQLKRVRKEIVILRHIAEDMTTDFDLSKLIAALGQAEDVLDSLACHSMHQGEQERAGYMREASVAFSQPYLTLCPVAFDCREGEESLLQAAAFACADTSSVKNGGADDRAGGARLVRKALAVDWSRRDMLVGSVRSKKQFYHQIKEKYYYLPAKYMPEDAGSLAFVSMYLPRRYDDAGIRYYGRITRITYLVRSQIPYPMSRNNPDEMYCRLDVASWHARSVPISIKEEGVYIPQMTYSFLFVHCRETYELFHIHSAEDFLLLQKLRNLAQKNAPERGFTAL